jgi:hypothetical protein
MKLDPGMHIVMHLVFFGKNRCDTGAGGCGTTYITRDRVLRVYHWMYASHAVLSWGRSSVKMFCDVVSQPSTYDCTF